MAISRRTFCAAGLLAAGAARSRQPAGDDRVEQYHVVEVPFRGPEQGPADTPARDIELTVTFRHESGESVRVAGFWDGDGAGNARGRAFKVRFCPTRAGRWQIAETASNRDELRGQREGEVWRCEESRHPGLWLADGRWYRRSDNSHPLVVGNTHYSFLSRMSDRGRVEGGPADDVRGNAGYFKKLRFGLTGCRYPDPDLKPFLDARGRPTDDGAFSLRPNPAWFAGRADPAVQEGFRQDLVCDLILCGPDTREARSTLQGDPAPWLRYVAARYGSYPNVWLCLCNEWDIKNPRYRAEQIRGFGATARRFLPHPTPLSVHGAPSNWDRDLNGDWHDHVIIQAKIRTIPQAADAAARNFGLGGGKPVVNDENAYEGRGDGFSELDTVEGCVGTFLGGGYPTTGEKYGNKLGQYFWGGFDPAAHRAADNLRHLRRFADGSVRFWAMAPLRPADTPFARCGDDCRVLGDGDGEYLLGTNRGADGLRVRLPEGSWRVTQADLVAGTTRELAAGAAGEFTFTAPRSRACLTHFRRVEG